MYICIYYLYKYVPIEITPKNNIEIHVNFRTNYCYMHTRVTIPHIMVDHRTVALQKIYHPRWQSVQFETMV